MKKIPSAQPPDNTLKVAVRIGTNKTGVFFRQPDASFSGEALARALRPQRAEPQYSARFATPFQSDVGLISL
jgi:hypothetical protein